MILFVISSVISDKNYMADTLNLSKEIIFSSSDPNISRKSFLYTNLHNRTSQESQHFRWV